MMDPMELNARSATISFGEEFVSVDVVFDLNKKAKVIVPADSSMNPATYLVNSHDSMANIALCHLARRLVAAMLNEKAPE